MKPLPRRIIKETQRLIDDPVEGIIARPDEDNLRYFHVTIDGPIGSPYEGGKFRMELFLPEEYPMAPPKIRFVTRLFHPNVDKLGLICLDILRVIFPSFAIKINRIIKAIDVEFATNSEVNKCSLSSYHVWIPKF
ncbi:hypothetical protein GJ496_000887 [Pomphorhynchus laevis]|nr:hypothetical protein GJ496_000887 [Pomphorhynchus laevis]